MTLLPHPPTPCDYRGAGACSCARAAGLEGAFTGAEWSSTSLSWEEETPAGHGQQGPSSWTAVWAYGDNLRIDLAEPEGRYVLQSGANRLACTDGLAMAKLAAELYASSPDRHRLLDRADSYPDQTGDELDPLIRARAFIAASRWTFASTMPEIPHEYTVKHRFAPPAEFDRMVLQIRAHGFEAAFYDRTFMYWIVDDHKYWTMGAPADETTVINREHVDPAVRQRQRAEQRRGNRYP